MRPGRDIGCAAEPEVSRASGLHSGTTPTTVDWFELGANFNQLAGVVHSNTCLWRSPDPVRGDSLHISGPLLRIGR